MSPRGKNICYLPGLAVIAGKELPCFKIVTSKDVKTVVTIIFCFNFTPLPSIRNNLLSVEYGTPVPILIIWFLLSATSPFKGLTAENNTSLFSNFMTYLFPGNTQCYHVESLIANCCILLY